MRFSFFLFFLVLLAPFSYSINESEVCQKFGYNMTYYSEYLACQNLLNYFKNLSVIYNNSYYYNITINQTINYTICNNCTYINQTYSDVTLKQMIEKYASDYVEEYFDNQTQYVSEEEMKEEIIALLTPVNTEVTNLKSLTQNILTEDRIKAIVSDYIKANPSMASSSDQIIQALLAKNNDISDDESYVGTKKMNFSDFQGYITLIVILGIIGFVVYMGIKSISKKVAPSLVPNTPKSFYDSWVEQQLNANKSFYPNQPIPQQLNPMYPQNGNSAGIIIKDNK
jgi:hypothetical protein